MNDEPRIYAILITAGEVEYILSAAEDLREILILNLEALDAFSFLRTCSSHV